MLAELTFVSERGRHSAAREFHHSTLVTGDHGREVCHIVQVRERGARLHVQITALFSEVAVVPAVLVAAVATSALAAGSTISF